MAVEIEQIFGVPQVRARSLGANLGADAVVEHATQVGAKPAPACSPAEAVDLSSAVGQPLAQLLKRPEITIEHVAPVLRNLAPEFFARNSSANSAPSAVNLSSEIRNELKSIETEIKYAGYLDQQQRAIERLKKAEQRRIPDWFDYRAVSGLSREMQEKLGHVVPQTLAQASRIPGVTPAAVSLINVYIEIQGRRREQASAL
jgi:tRNA uridine 5-carboxymethylaminomethyl modification enzyme